MSKIIKSAKRVLALALAFALVLGYFPIDVFAEDTTKTVYVGVVQWITDHVPTLHYWNNSGAEGDTALQPTGKTLYASVGGYWSGETQMFYLYTAQIPGDTTGVKTWDGSTNDRWAAEDAAYQENQVVLVFEYDGIYHNITQACHDTAHGTDSYCDVCGTYFGHTYDASGVCTGCGTSCAHESHDAEGNCAVCGVAVNHSFDAEGNCVCGISNNVPAVISDEIPCAHESHDAEGKCSACGEAVSHSFDAEGKCACGAVEEAPCAHESHTAEGKCAACGEAVNHSFDAEGKCVCGISNNVPAAISNEIPCAHENHDAEGKCSACGEDVGHSYDNGFCTTAEGEVHLQAAELNADGWYEISNAGQLYWFAQQVDNGTGANYNAVLTANITVNQGTMSAESTTARKWNPIGSYDAVYNGTFDGNEKTVSGLYLNDNSQEYVGLIAVVGEGATVKDVTLSNSYLYAKQWVGGIAAANNGAIEGCINNSRIETRENNAGGIVGTNKGTVKQCGNTGAISANGVCAGGVAADNRGLVTECWNQGNINSIANLAAGIAAYNGGEITKCWNMGYINTDAASAGGIAGCSYGAVRNCWNNADVSCGFVWSGGIVGLQQKFEGTESVVENCWSMGDIEMRASGAGDGGDIVGIFEGAVIIRNCYSTKRVIGEYMTEWDTSAMLTDVTEKPTAAFESGEITWLLNGKTSEGELVWGQNLVDGEGRQGVPTFDAPVVYEIQETCSGEVSYSNTPGNNVKHNYENGFCVNKKADGVTNCDAYEPAELLTAERCAELGLDAAYKGYYAIKNAGNLYWFAQQVDNGTGAGYNAVLIDNIKVNDGTMSAESTTARKWNPIGFANAHDDRSGAYEGTFDGNGKTISGLYFADITNSDISWSGTCVALFACTTQSAVVKNVKLDNSYFHGYAYVAGMVGINDGVIEGCTNNATIVAQESAAAGIAAFNYKTVENCTNSGSVTGMHTIAGIVANNQAKISGCINNGNIVCTVDGQRYFAGIAAYSGNGIVELCVNNGKIIGEHKTGGIVGESKSGIIIKCLNHGDIEATNSKIGGIVGEDNYTPIVNCGNTGNITGGTEFCGGLTGYLMDTKVYNSYSTGTVNCTGNSTGNFVGHIFGGSAIYNCYTIGAQSDVYGHTESSTVFVTAVDPGAFTSGEVANLLQDKLVVPDDMTAESLAWGQDLDNGKNVQSYPSFDGDKVYHVVKDCSGAMGYSNTDSPAPDHVYVNGFCDQVANETHYEPAEKLTAERCAELGLDATVYEGYYAIKNAGNLYWFAEYVDSAGQVNNKQHLSSAVLLADIKVNDITVNGTKIYDSNGAEVENPNSLRAWNPIAGGLVWLYGTFDGCGHTVSGLYFNNPSEEHVGLVGKLGGTVKDVTVTNSYFNGKSRVGGIAGYVGDKDGTVQNASVTDSYISGYQYVGGIVGDNVGTITGCENTSTVYATTVAGGIVGRNVDSKTSGVYGIVELCGNSGTVSGGEQLGGIAGGNAGIIRNCWNTATIKATNDHVGGIVGFQRADATGANKITVLENCWSIGAVSTGDGYDNCGGILGIIYGGTTAQNSYSIALPIGSENTQDGTPTVTDVEWRTEESFNNGEVAYLLRTNAAEGTNVWGQDLDNGKPQQPHPTFDGAAVYQIAVNCAGDLGYSNASENKDTHKYSENGFCINPDVNGDPCDAYEPAVEVKADNWESLGLTADYVGYYAITNAGQLYWFADKVDNDNANFGTANVVLTDNITVNSGSVNAESTGMRQWNPIGYYYYDYDVNNGAIRDERPVRGIFDGNGKTVSGLYFNDEEADGVGLIAYTAGNALVKNVNLSNSYIRGCSYVGGIVGFHDGAAVTGCTNNATVDGDNIVGGIVGGNYCGDTVEKCGNTGIVTAISNRTGGIVGYNLGIIRNCWNSGSIGASYDVGGIMGGLAHGYGETLVENCWSTGTITGDDSDSIGGIVGRQTWGSIQNCYAVSNPIGIKGNNIIITDVEQKGLDQFTSGEVAYLLRTNAAGTNVWGQDLDNNKPVQTAPSFDGAVVYKVTVDCAGNTGYSNSESAAPDHVYVNGFCDQVAGETHYQPAELLNAERCAELGLDAAVYNGYYAITNGGNLYWFAELVDYGKQYHNAVLLNDIEVNQQVIDASGALVGDSSSLRVWNPIGHALKNYFGTIDGRGCTISGLYFNDATYTGSNGPTTRIGLVSVLSGTVKNVTLADSYFNACDYAGAIAGKNIGNIIGCVNTSTICANGYAGGIAGENIDTKSAGAYGIVELCGNRGKVVTDKDIAGGICGINQSVIRNCWNIGAITAGTDNAGGIAGLQKKADESVNVDPLVENCWSTGAVSAGENRTSCGGILGIGADGTVVSNCYSVALPIGDGNADSGTPTLTNVEWRAEDSFKDGEVAYLLRFNAAEGTNVWGQDLNNGKPVQTYPTFDGAPVYKITVNCSGVMGYSNTNSAAPDHVYDEKGFCDQVPDQTHYEPANRVTGETWQSLGLTVDHIGYYAIQKPGHLFWFAEKVNTSAPGFGTANAVLVNDITVNEPGPGEIRKWFGIGFAGDSQGVSASVNPYCGTFDGNGFTVSGLNTEGNGYFTGLVNYLGEGGVVKNVTVSNSTMQNSETGLGAGAVVGWNRGTVTNCYNNSALSDNRYIGGIVGLNMGLVELCGNSGIITIKADTVMPFSRLRTANNEDIVKAAGGIAARNAGIVRNCWNSATIAIDNGNAGGMVGEQLTKVTVFDSYECSDVRLEYCWSNGVVTSGGKAGGIAGTVATDSFISTCYTNMETPVGSAKYDENNVITKTDEQFKSGEVTFLLQNPQAVQVWGQNIDNGGVNEGHPAFSPAVTYYHALNCAGVRVYTNIQDPNTDHSFVYKKMVDSTCTGTGTIEYWVCEICGRLFREENENAIIDPEDIVTAPKGHLYGPEGACIRINDGKLCGHPAGASLTTKTCGTVFYDTLQQALDAAKTTVKADEALVKVLQDVTSTEISAVTAEGGVFTLDIGEFDLVGDDYGLSIENADVTITGTTGYIDCIYAQDSDLTISGATVSATKSDSIGINMHNSNLTVESGSVVNNKYSGYAIYGYGAGCTIDIQGGAISATGNTGKGIALSGGTTVSVSGGTIDAAEDIVVTDGLTDLTGILSGGTFPGGLAAKENGTAVSVNKLLSGGYSYWQQDKQVDVEDSAVSIQGDVQVNAVCKHPAITYSASGAVLSAHCDTCSAASVLELIPQTDADKIYSGTEKSVAYTGSILGVDTVPIVYEGDRVNVGTFKASVTVGDATVQMPMEILPYELEIKTFEPETKTYDGTTTCGVKSLTFVSTANGEELVLGTDFTAVLTFSSKNAGSYDDAVLTAQLLDTPLASNYVLKTDKVTGVSHTINPAVITVTDVKIQERHYDGTTDATVTDVTITGGVTGDDVKVLVDAVLEDKNSGENKTVNLTYTLSGEDAGNYVLAEETGTTTAKITVKPLPEIMEPVKDLSVDNATSDNKPALEDVKEELEHVLTDEGLTDEERKEREDALKEVQDMLDRIQEAADAIKTDPIIDTKHITAENVVPEDRDDILEALDDLYGALENYENNYTEKEKEGIHDDIERLEAALAALKAVEDVIKRIQDLPGEVEPDTPYRPDILITKDMYDDLPERLKDMIPDELVKKLNDLLDDLKDYRIIKGDGQTWSDGDLGFTANGPCDRFVQLLIDGNVVDASNYTVVSGSTVLTIKESYAETLTAGKHSISFVYPDGQAVGSFTVVIPTNGSAITGDDTPVMLLAVMMSVSLAGAVMLLHRKRKVEV